MAPDNTNKNRCPKTLCVPVPAAVAAELGTVTGKDIAPILVDKLLGAETGMSSSWFNDWDSVLGKKRLAPPLRGSGKSGRRSRLVTGAVPPTPAGPEPTRPDPTACEPPAAVGLALVITGLQKYRSIVNAPIPGVPQYQEIVWNVRKQVPFLIATAKNLLRRARTLIAERLGVRWEELEGRCRAAMDFSEAVAHGRTAQPADIRSTAVFCSELGIVEDRVSGIIIEGAMGVSEHRPSVPVSAQLRQALEQLSDQTGLGMGAIASAALLAHQMKTPLDDLFRRYAERRLLTRLAKDLIELDAVVKSYNTRLNARPSPRADSLLRDFVESVRGNIGSLGQANLLLLRVVGAWLTGRAEIDLVALKWRSDHLVHFCRGAATDPKHVRQCNLDLAASLVQRMWSQRPDDRSVLRQMIQARWTDLTIPFTSGF